MPLRSWRCAVVAAVIGSGGAMVGCSEGARSEPGSRRSDTPPATTADSGGGAAAAGADAGFGNAEGQDAAAAPPVVILPPVDAGSCVNLQCQQHQCVSGATTTISGTVYDPAGNNPLYNVAVYVPNEPVEALGTGASCDACDTLYTGNPIAAALTDGTGRFTLENAPDGTDIPLIVQIGKWRRQLTIASVAPCQDNPQPDGMLRLPRNTGEGDIPHIAVSTGGADTLECLLRRVGVDASEYVAGADRAGRVHIFKGNPLVSDPPGGAGRDASPDTSPPAPIAADALWSSVDDLMMYDVVLLSCEGNETIGMNQQVLHDYADAGGRVFASHFHYSWFNTGPYGTENLATWTRNSNEIGDTLGTIVTALPDGEPFPKGMALLTWLQTVGALKDGRLPIVEARHNADVSAANTPSQPWIVADSDLHVGGASGDDPMAPVPTGCADGQLSPQEAALEFMLFDLSSCITPDEVPPRPPRIVVD